MFPLVPLESMHEFDVEAKPLLILFGRILTLYGELFGDLLSQPKRCSVMVSIDFHLKFPLRRHFVIYSTLLAVM